MGSKISEVSIIFTASGTDQVIAQIQQITKSQEGLEQGAKKAGSGTQKGFNPANNALTEFGKKWQGVVAAATTAAVPIMATIGAIKKMVEFSREGAELQYLEGRFGSLAGTIGTTSTALMYDLRAATRGMMSDSELMRGATDLMALGLVSTREEAVRLTSVVGSLGWNMDQLTLSITNETTRRLDTLGLSVESVKNRYEELKDSGIEGQRAMMLAITEAGEAMIELGGHVADSPLGSWKSLESSRSTFFDNLKKDLADGMSWWAEFWDAQYKQANSEHLYKELLKQAKEYGMEVKNLPSPYVGNEGKSGAFYDEATGTTTYAVYDLEAGEGAIKTLTEMIDAHERAIASEKEFSASMAAGHKAMSDYANGIMPVIDAFDKASITALMAAGDYEKLASVLGVTTEEAKRMTSEWEKHEKMFSQLEGIKSLEGNYNGIIDLAYKYTNILADITEQETIMANNPIGSKKYEEAKGKVEALKGSMADLANRVTLDMFQATIAIGGVTAAELSAYMQMAVDMGLMSEEGAQAAIDAYGKAIETINGYKIDEKTGNVNIDAVSAFATLDLLQQYSLLDKEQRVFVTTYYGTSHGYDPYENYGNNAIGGAVYPNRPYIWQEPGREGELLIPERYGRVMSATEVSQMLRDALTPRRESGGVRGEQVVNNNYYYNLTMPTSSSPADVRAAFELMEAWNR